MWLSNWLFPERHVECGSRSVQRGPNYCISCAGRMLIFSILFAVGSAFSQEPGQSAATPSVSMTTAAGTDSELVLLRHQNKLLKAQIKSAESFQGAVLDTVYWALGGVLGVLSLVFGISWFTNFKLSDRDRRSLHDEMDARITLLSQQVASVAETSSTTLDHRFSAQESYLREELDDLKESTGREIIKAVESSLVSLRLELNRIGLVALRAAISAEGDADKRHEFLRLYLSGAVSNSAYEIPHALAFVNRLVTEGMTMSVQNATYLNNILSRVPTEHSVFAEQVRDRLAASIR